MQSQTQPNSTTAGDDDLSRQVTLYSVNGLFEEPMNWLGRILPDFTARTGISVRYHEDHSRDIVKAAQEAPPGQGPDVIITLSPFVQMAAKAGVFRAYQPKGAEQLTSGGGDAYHLLIRNYPNLLVHTGPGAVKVDSYTDLLNPVLKGKIQYSKPGWSGAGTAFLLQVFKAFRGKEAGLEFLRALQANCLAPCEHTQGLASRIDTGELFVGNGDLQSNFPYLSQFRNLGLVMPAAPDGRRYAYEFSYYAGLAAKGVNREAGEALLDFLFEASSQRLISEIANGLPGRHDIVPQGPAHRAFTELLGDVHIWEPDWMGVIETLDADVARYDRVVLS